MANWFSWSLGRESEEAVGVRKAVPRRRTDAMEEVIFLRGLGIVGGFFGGSAWPG